MDIIFIILVAIVCILGIVAIIGVFSEEFMCTPKEKYELRSFR